MTNPIDNLFANADYKEVKTMKLTKRSMFEKWRTAIIEAKEAYVRLQSHEKVDKSSLSSNYMCDWRYFYQKIAVRDFIYDLLVENGWKKEADTVFFECYEDTNGN